MNYSAILLSSDEGLFKQDESINQFVVKALNFLIRNVFESLTSTYAVFISSRDEPTLRWMNHIMVELFSLTTAMTVQIVQINVKRKMALEMHGRKQCNILLVDSYQALLDIGLASSNAFVDDLEYYLIFLQARDNEIPREMKLILQHCLDNYWLHCNVMIQTAKGEILMYTYFPYTADHCYKAKPKLIDFFDGERFKNPPFLPDKLYNLHKCPLSVNTWSQLPYVAIENLPNGTLHYSGMDIQLLKALSDKMNFTLKVKYRDVEKLISAISERKVNMTVSYTRRALTLDRIVSSTVTTFHTTLVAVVIRNPYPLSSMKTLVFPYKANVWICLLCCLLVMICINQMRRQTNPMTNLQFLEILLGLSTSYRPQFKWQSLSVLTWLWSSLLLRSLYQSMLYYLYNFDIFENLPQSLDALAQQGFTLICSRNTMRYLEKIQQVEENLLPVIVMNTSNEMHTLTYLDNCSKGNYAAIVDKEIAKYFLNNMESKNSLEILPFTVNNIQTIIYLPKHSFLIETINDYILRFFASGFQLAWKIHYTGVDHPNNDESQRTISEMSFMHVISVLEMTSILYFVSFVIFLLELYSRKSKFVQNVFDKLL
ncbi:uncharacterized protein LOC131802192 [Musca domestica]|uniref:Uncharacterized protein LOC131802192 n=1 Tax=Musca domestica TaxID=7370 RepID=A0ABM3UW83_MUSDO|nr:uncharacterized protein LOC131802192 [Musca domestica]